MAEEDEAKPSEWQNPLFALIALFFITRLITSIPENLEENYGFDLSDPVGSFSARVSLSEETPIGTGVRTTREAEVLEDPAGALRGVVADGARGTLDDGPARRAGRTWWRVDFRDPSVVDGWVGQRSLESASVFSYLNLLMIMYMVFAALLSVLFLIGITYVVMRLNQIRTAQLDEIRAGLPQREETPRMRQWEHITELVASDRASDWRQAIIEADIMLDELVTRLGYRGAGLGEKLKNVEAGDFRTLDKAWEAHKMRNRVAHGGASVSLSQREAQQTIGHYRDVFEEFDYL